MLKAIHRMQRDERGFTLVELLIVIAIIAILAAIAIPQFSSYRDKAKIAGATADMKSCLSAAMANYANTGEATGDMVCGTAIVAVDATGKVTKNETTAKGVSCTYDSATGNVSCTSS